MLDKNKIKQAIKEFEKKISLQAPIFNERDINHLNNLKELFTK
tara:strand:+ start:2768 stop:2896 length:129 start_codon:yes stop_codon:yes gene_type:complete